MRYRGVDPYVYVEYCDDCSGLVGAKLPDRYLLYRDFDRGEWDRLSALPTSELSKAGLNQSREPTYCDDCYETHLG